MTRRPIPRRAVLAGLAALPCAPRPARASALAAAFDAAARMRQLHALAVARGGEVIEAQAFRGPGLNEPVNVKSVSKSLVSALTGIAIHRGELFGVNQTVAPLLPRAVPRRADARVRQITVGHLLTMRSGLQRLSGAAYADWTAARHWVYDALSRPMVADPGTEMLYSTASYHILGAVLAEVAGMDLHALAQSRLGDPLGIVLPRWTRDPQGRYLGGNDMAFSPLAMIRFGELYRRAGLWHDRRVLTDDWVKQSWEPRTRSVETGHGYGYGWYVWQAQGHPVYYARGYGGQMIHVVPGLDLTVAITSDPGRPASLDGHLGALDRLLADRIVPAIAAMG